ncbi:hypothetical protein P7K49_022081 [Saguinus oedipus]|uniref:Uncharacterized protein n=1 Tax=Saguinus oedipus TaxID=9490 RepID=A0ABQ9UW80_SAGOE|nr:hypothetical protein P7K49_022081 [Saguinus oedipus]
MAAGTSAPISDSLSRRGSLGREEQRRPPPPARRPALCSPGRKAASCPPATSKRAPSCPINPPGTDSRLATASPADKRGRNHHSLSPPQRRAAPPTPSPTHLPAGRPGSGTPAVRWSRANGPALPAGPRASCRGARGPSHAPSPSGHTRASVRVGHLAMTARRVAPPGSACGRHFVPLEKKRPGTAAILERSTRRQRRRRLHSPSPRTQQLLVQLPPQDPRSRCCSRHPVLAATSIERRLTAGAEACLKPNLSLLRLPNPPEPPRMAPSPPNQRRSRCLPPIREGLRGGATGPSSVAAQPRRSAQSHIREVSEAELVA